MSCVYMFRYRYIIRANKGGAGGVVSLMQCRDGKEVEHLCIWPGEPAWIGTPIPQAL